MTSRRPGAPILVAKLAAAPAFVLSSPDGVKDWVIVDHHHGRGEIRWAADVTPLAAMEESARTRETFLERRQELPLRVFVACTQDELGEFGISPETRMRVA